MTPERHDRLISGAVATRTRVLGAVLGLLGGLLLGGIVLPSRLITAPLTALAAAATAVITEQRLRQVRHTPALSLWGATIGSAIGMVAGAVVGLAAALLVALYLLILGQPSLAPFALLAETAAITGLAGLLAGFTLGLK